MARLLHIALLACTALVLTGCDQPQEDEPVWKKVKITDLAPVHVGSPSESQGLKTINLTIYFIEVPAENISQLNDIWRILHTDQFRFNDRRAFEANLFSVGFGQARMWNKITNLLCVAGDKNTAESLSLLLRPGQPDDLTILSLYREQKILHISAEGLTEGVKLGPGTISLRIKAEKIPSARGVCNITVLPTFLSPSAGRFLQSKHDRFLFTSAAFELKMSPGDMFFLAPTKYSDNRMTLGSLFFSTPKPRPVVRTFLFVCNRIID